MRVAQGSSTSRAAPSTGRFRGRLTGGLQPDRRGLPRPGRVRPRPLRQTREDVLHRWTWIPFGAGRHRCVGAAFGTMQIKAIFSVLLREFDFEMAQPSQEYP